MARPSINPLAAVASIEKAPWSDLSDGAAETVADGLLAALEERCGRIGAEPRDAALAAILELCAALLAFGGVRSEADLIAWLRRNLPQRARELAEAAALDDARPPTCTLPPPCATWN